LLSNFHCRRLRHHFISVGIILGWGLVTLFEWVSGCTLVCVAAGPVRRGGWGKCHCYSKRCCSNIFDGIFALVENHVRRRRKLLIRRQLGGIVQSLRSGLGTTFLILCEAFDWRLDGLDPFGTHPEGYLHYAERHILVFWGKVRFGIVVLHCYDLLKPLPRPRSTNRRISRLISFGDFGSA
jgi:hypothetical protein